MSRALADTAGAPLERELGLPSQRTWTCGTSSGSRSRPSASRMSSRRSTRGGCAPCSARWSPELTSYRRREGTAVPASFEGRDGRPRLLSRAVLMGGD
jgi:hypothetical protein